MNLGLLPVTIKLFCIHIHARHDIWTYFNKQCSDTFVPPGGGALLLLPFSSSASANTAIHAAIIIPTTLLIIMLTIINTFLTKTGKIRHVIDKNADEVQLKYIYLVK